MKVYADNAATTKTSAKAKEAMMPYFDVIYGNPSSLHTFGQEAREALEKARASVAKSIGAEPREIYFTSGGSEADNQAIVTGAKLGAKLGKKHIISTKIEHHAVLHTLDKLEKEGFEITLLDVDQFGMVSAEAVGNAIREDTALVTVMYANNEIGTVLPIREIGKVCMSRSVLFHTDAVQAIGHIPVDVRADNIDILSLSGHKFHGPKGVGVMYCKKGIPVQRIVEGGAQERGKRGGTENLPAIVGLAVALEDAVANLSANAKYVSGLRDKLIAGLSKIPKAILNGDRYSRLPGNVNFCFRGIEGESLLLMLDAKGVAASSGSACTSGSLDPSHVLLAIGLPHEIAHGSLRISICEYNTVEEIDYMIEVIPEIVERLRSISPVWERIEKGELEYVI